MTEPETEGLTEMPSGQDAGMVGEPATGTTRATAGLMPGEEAQPGSRGGEMPGGGMSRME